MASSQNGSVAGKSAEFVDFTMDPRAAAPATQVVVPAGDAPTVVILTALGLEYQAVRAHLIQPALVRHPQHSYFEIGRIPGMRARIVLAETGTFNQSAAVVTDRAFGWFNPAAVLFVGVAGGLHDDLAIGDLVVGTRIYDYHGGVDSEEGFLARPQSWEGTHELVELARHVARTGDWAQRLSVNDRQPMASVHFKPIAAGSVVLKSRRGMVAQQLRRSYNDAAAIETESAGVAFASHLNQASALTIRAICDRADETKHEADIRGWQPWAARRAAAFAVALISEFAAARSLQRT